jgi:hypothetical protein
MDRENIERRLRELDLEIAEVMQRLPAHSVKPPVMQELLDLEDERDMLMNSIAEEKG